MLDGTSVHETQTPCKNDIKPGSMGLLLNSTRHKHLLHSPPLPWRYIFRTVALSDLQKKQTLGKCSERLHELITSCMCHISQTFQTKSANSLCETRISSSSILSAKPEVAAAHDRRSTSGIYIASSVFRKILSFLSLLHGMDHIW